MSYVRIWLHCVWGTKNRTPFIVESNKKAIIGHIRENAIKKGIYIDFINGHKEHHRKKTWKEEYEEFMNKYGFEKIKG